MASRFNMIGVLVLATAIAAAAWLVSSLSGTPLVGYDDANIFFVYAKNLLDGHGFVYYAGGERVEGFTSLSWLLICAAAMPVANRFEIILFAINCLAMAFSLWSLLVLVASTLHEHAGLRGSRAVTIAAGLTAAVTFTPGSMAWNVVSLMDAGLWSSLLLLATLVVVRLALREPDSADAGSARALPFLIGALVITRPEALLWAPLLIALAAFVTVMRGGTMAAAAKQHVASIAAFAVSIAALFAWRLWYFGYPLPNTYYAKAGDPLGNRLAEGFVYVADFLISNPAVPVMILASAWSAAVSRRHTRLFCANACVLVIMIAGCLVPALEGGDHFGFWRMLQPIVPLVALQAALTAAVAIVTRPDRPGDVTAAWGIALLLALVPWRHWPALPALEYASGGRSNTPKIELSIAEDMRVIGAAFTRAFPEIKPRVGVIVAGGFAFTYDGPTLDLMGLNHVAMAHSAGPRYGLRNHAAFNKEVFFSLAPEVLLLSLWSPQRPDWFGFPMLSGVYPAPANLRPDYFRRRALSVNTFDSGVLKGMLNDQRIAAWAWASVRPAGGSEWINAVFRRDFLNRLRELGYEVVMPGPPPRA